MQRRHFLARAAALPFTAHLGQLRAAAPQTATPRLLLVFLRGAYDSNSLLVPTHSDFYYEARPGIAIARPGQAQGALALDSQWGLHPALAGSIHPLFMAGQTCFVPFAGTHDLSRSHFETQDGIEMGQGAQGSHSSRSGFLNRLAQALSRDGHSRATPMAFTGQLPLVLRGSLPAPNMALSSVGRGGVDDRHSQVIASMYEGSPLADAVREGFAVRDAVQRSVQQEMDQAGRDAISAKGFSLVARRMAALMRERFDLGFVDVGGWDTHVNQGGATGALANRLEELGQGLAGFAQEIGPQAWRHTVVVVISEFGRTFRENGNRGTDHGHGTAYWVLGGGLSSRAGGRIVGEQVEVSQKNLFQNRDHPVLNEYRALLGGLFRRMYGLGPEPLQSIFPGTAPQEFSII